MLIRTLMTLLLSLVVLAGCGSDASEEPKTAKKEPTFGENASPTPSASSLPVLQLAHEAGTYETFLELVKENQLDAFLANQSPVTIFAPTDEAFAKMPTGTLDRIRKNPKHLELFLTPHVLPEREIFESGLTDGESLSTMTGTLEISVDGDTIKVDEATIIEPDMRGSDGVLHGIDSVITDGIDS